MNYNPYAEIVARIRAEKWSQRQDGTTDQLADLIDRRTNPDALPPHERIKP